MAILLATSHVYAQPEGVDVTIEDSEKADQSSQPDIKENKTLVDAKTEVAQIISNEVYSSAYAFFP